MSEDLYKEIFSRKLKYYMELNNKTQADLINDLGLKSATVSNWCTGLKLPRMGKIQMLADYFHINKSDLIEETSPLPNKVEYKSDPKIIAASGGGLTNVDERMRELISDKQELCNAIYAANLDKRQIKELLGIVKAFEKI